MSIKSSLIKPFLLMSVAMLIFLTGCKKERFVTDGNAQIRFSVDTLMFDTVFTERGSATRLFKIYNDLDDRLKIKKIYMKNGDASVFRLNVDGISASVFNDIEIGGQDSLYVFVEVTINPDQPIGASPFIIEEYMVFEVLDQKQELLIDAWGQNANYIPNRFHRNQTGLLTCDLGTITWDDPKPYVLFGQLIVDSCTLVLPAGTTLYIHGGIARTKDIEGNTVLYNDGSMLFGPNAKLLSQGTVDNPVIIRGDRLEHEYDDEPGQWNGLIFSKTSTGNTLEHTIIKNAIFGLFVDSAATMEMNNTIISHTSSYGILSFHPQKIKMTNCAIYDNGNQSLLGLYGGDFDINYCTFANYGNDKEAINLFDYYCSDFPTCSDKDGEVIVHNPVNANFTNCIITGSNKDEFWISHDKMMGEMNLSINNCLLKLDEIFEMENYPEFMSIYTKNSLQNNSNDKLFVSVDKYDFHLDTLSQVEGKGISIPTINIDIEGNLRDGVMPDIGCYEYVY